MKLRSEFSCKLPLDFHEKNFGKYEGRKEKAKKATGSNLREQSKIAAF